LENVLKSSLELAQAQQKVADALKAVEDAQEDVTKLEYRRASDDLLQQTQDEIDLAREKVSKAEDAYKRFKNRPDGDSLKAQASLNLVNARTERDDKIALLNWYLGKYDEIDAAQYRAALAVAQAQLANAQREVERLKDGPNAEDVAAAQARVDAAQATVNSLFIVAPFDGEVLAVEQVAGDAVKTGTVAVYLADMRHLYVEAQVDESDIASVQVGQAAEVTLDALPGVTFTGQVKSINPVGESVSGLVKYKVRIDLEPASDQTFIPLGTTANVSILVQEARAALTVPITAIQNDAQGEFVLTVDKRRVNVVTGAIVDDRVIVSGDLQEGQSLLLNTASSFEAPNPLSGGE
jgi:HlyD family secretion protein